jgi:agmatine/peptidylarginine deiminase
MTTHPIYFPSEWHNQDAVQLTWPNPDTDWSDMLDEITPCYLAMAKEILKKEKLIIVAQDISAVQELFNENGIHSTDSLYYCETNINDTWARDHSGISVIQNDAQGLIYDFAFNGWGNKYPYELDNKITEKIFHSRIIDPAITRKPINDFVLEGGSIESDGNGTILSTSSCLFNKNRNPHLTQDEITNRLKSLLGAERILMLHNGHLEGDDTDGHIDTIARFCSKDDIAYVKCTDPADEHYAPLLKMEQELQAFTRPDGRPYNLHPLPMADKTVFENRRLPATYANFLIINDAILMPAYNSPKDAIALQTLQTLFPTREVIPINALPLIRQGGSIHCATMQYPKHFISSSSCK